MAAPEIRVDYEKLDEIASLFEKNCESIQALLKRVESRSENLRQGWMGRGSEAFFAEMEQDVLPRVRRLVSSLDDASQITRAISETVGDAEERAGNAFNQAFR
jgi:WXG100 family type VII secretion target